jgi:hypothetical protein
MAVPVTGQVQRAPASPLFPLSLPIAVAIVAVFGIAGAAIDVLAHQEVRLVFAIGFGIGCGIAAILVRREDVVRTVIWIPIVYFALLLIGTGISGGNRPVNWLVLAIVFKAPVVVIGWGAAVAIGILRAIAARRTD